VWFPDVSERGIAASLIPFPAIPGRKALLAALPAGARFTAEALTGFMNSLWAEGLLGLFTPERHHKPSYVGQIPWVEAAALPSELHFRRMVELISREAPSELSPFFRLPDVLRHRRATLGETADWLRWHWSATRQEIVAELMRFDDEVVRLIRASADDVALLKEMSQRGPVESWFPTEHALEGDLLPQLAADLACFLIGRSLGHYPPTDPREVLATHNLRVNAVAAQRMPSRTIILVDDEGHNSDVIAAVKTALGEYWDHPDEIFREVELAIAGDGSFRSWIAKQFFGVHLSRFTKSRRAAPLYWQLATPSASYSVWLYLHSFTGDTMFRVQNEFVGPKLAHEERRLESITNELRDGATAAQRKALAAQEEFVEELRAFVDEVKRVAPLWNPNLDDGVIINFAPLWRLVPQDKSWQRELKSTWGALCEGNYDWAYLAMHLWPERVVPKCAKDRSLAIAHGLEDVFWAEGIDGKWTGRKTPTRSIDELVRERTSPAVKSALKSLLEAPAATSKSTGRGRGSRRKASAAAAEGGDA
jgi:hypothetical protein